MTSHGIAGERCEAPLLPLGRFDHPHLHRRPDNIVATEADRQMDLIVRKECAGLRHDLRGSGARLRRAFINGHVGRSERMVLEWTVSGMREFLFPTWHSLCALTIYELARGMRILGPNAGGYATYLNQWGENPDLPLPSPEGWTLFVDDFSCLPPAALKLGEGHACREDIPELEISILNLDGLRYSLPTMSLRKLQTASGTLTDRHTTPSRR